MSVLVRASFPILISTVCRDEGKCQAHHSKHKLCSVHPWIDNSIERDRCITTCISRGEARRIPMLSPHGSRFACSPWGCRLQGLTSFPTRFLARQPRSAPRREGKIHVTQGPVFNLFTMHFRICNPFLTDRQSLSGRRSVHIRPEDTLLTRVCGNPTLCTRGGETPTASIDKCVSDS